VVSVHDVIFKRFPEYFSLRDRALFSLLLPSSLRRAAAIFTLSAHGREELQRFYPGLRVPVHVVPAAAGDVFRPLDAAAIEPVLTRYGLHRPYLLAVGSVQPRKNLVRLIDAFQPLASAHPGLQLVIVGPGGFRASAVHDAVVARGLTDRVQLLGYVADTDLVALYNAAIALVYPSVYEGFGLPVVEAMACGRPVVAANTSSLPEVIGDAGLLVDPFDTSAIQGAMDRLVRDQRLAAELATRGLARAATFSWTRTAADALHAFEALCAARAA
jgi:glycosyltransferase involved in cell wall biosynthesis